MEKFDRFKGRTLKRCNPLFQRHNCETYPDYCADYLSFLNSFVFIVFSFENRPNHFLPNSRRPGRSIRL